MSIFWGRQCAFVFPIYVRKYRKYTIDRWIVVYTVCASAVISPLRQWLDSYAKTRLKMWHTLKHFIHMQSFCCRLILLSSLYIELALVCCTNPDNVHCFGTIFPNLNFVLPQSVPPARCIFNPTSTEVAQLSTTWRRAMANSSVHAGSFSWWVLQAFIPMGSNQKQRYGSEFAK